MCGSSGAPGESSAMSQDLARDFVPILYFHIMQTGFNFIISSAIFLAVAVVHDRM